VTDDAAIYCSSCGDPIVEYRKAWQKVEGWSRVHRKGGGTNALALRIPLQEFMCDGCMIRLKLFGESKQESLL